MEAPARYRQGPRRARWAIFRCTSGCVIRARLLARPNFFQDRLFHGKTVDHGQEAGGEAERYKGPAASATARGHRRYSEVAPGCGEGYFQYHAIPDNEEQMKAFRHAILRLWLQQRRRRSQRSRWRWQRFLENSAPSYLRSKSCTPTPMNASTPESEVGTLLSLYDSFILCMTLSFTTSRRFIPTLSTRKRVRHKFTSHRTCEREY